MNFALEGKDEKRKNIIVDEEVKNYIEQIGCDFRLKTSCGGPYLCPVKYSPPKKSDIDISAGNHMLFVSNSIYMRGYRKIGKELIGFRACSL